MCEVEDAQVSESVEGYCCHGRLPSEEPGKLMGVWRCEEVYLWDPPVVAQPLEDSWEEMKVRENP